MAADRVPPLVIVSPIRHGRAFRPRRPCVHAPSRGTEPSSSVCYDLRDL